MKHLRLFSECRPNRWNRSTPLFRLSRQLLSFLVQSRRVRPSIPTSRLALEPRTKSPPTLAVVARLVRRSPKGEAGRAKGALALSGSHAELVNGKKAFGRPNATPHELSFLTEGMRIPGWRLYLARRKALSNDAYRFCKFAITWSCVHLAHPIEGLRQGVDLRLSVLPVADFQETVTQLLG